ncbi:MAG: hypothetical protein LBV54_05210 [Puniceicoccales bacterium]|jgi:hypothetical protein|nr:hypothetical protein [Puniceicoccales bacterium]
MRILTLTDVGSNLDYWICRAALGDDVRVSLDDKVIAFTLVSENVAQSASMKLIGQRPVKERASSYKRRAMPAWFAEFSSQPLRGKSLDVLIDEIREDREI